jgi:hypothetical protein
MMAQTGTDLISRSLQPGFVRTSNGSLLGVAGVGDEADSPKGGLPVNSFERSLRRAVNPLSTGLTGAWCHSRFRQWALRREISLLTEMPRTRHQRKTRNHAEKLSSD